MSGSLWCKRCTTRILMKNGSSRWCWSHFLPRCLSGSCCGILGCPCTWCQGRQGILVLTGLWNSSRRFSSEVWICAHKGRIQLFFIMCLYWSYVHTNLSAVTLAFCDKLACRSQTGTLSAIKWRSIVCLDSPRHPKHREDIVHSGYDHIGRVGTEEVHHWLTWVGIHSHRGLDGRRPQKWAVPDFWVLWHLRELTHLE